MLEHEHLHLVPPAQGGAIRAAHSGEQLGKVHFTYPERRWWSLSQSRPIEVRETQDDSLLFTIVTNGLLGRTKVVRDADGESVGQLRRNWLEDARGRRFARLQPTRDGMLALAANRDLELAAVAFRGTDLELRFHAPILADPFAKMLVLAAALCLNGTTSIAHQLAEQSR